MLSFEKMFSKQLNINWTIDRRSITLKFQCFWQISTVRRAINNQLKTDINKKNLII